MKQVLSAQVLAPPARAVRAKTISIIELLSKFSTEHKSIKQLEKIRWDKRPVCAHCGGIDNISKPKSKKHTYWHKDCRKQFTVKTNTIMHASKIPTQKWAIAIYTVLTARKGVSSLQLSKELGITQKSSWFLLQRIRNACAQGTFKLSNIVEADETYMGGNGW
ncbi:ISSpo3, transposase [uncultured Candidatus Thioglobus sp.]|nr:ISSpo3, transposase [uncultured Candidatus Thioglobus sp.]